MSVRAVLMVREPKEDCHDIVLAIQKTDVNEDIRLVMWGSQDTGMQGFKMEKVTTPFDDYVANRIRTGYVSQVDLNVHVPDSEVIDTITNLFK